MTMGLITRHYKRSLHSSLRTDQMPVCEKKPFRSSEKRDDVYSSLNIGSMEIFKMIKLIAGALRLVNLASVR